MNVILLLLGCVLEGTAILLIIVPVFIPTAQALGIDMVHFGVVVVLNIMLGLVTPPYGLLLFIMTNIAEVPLRDIVRDVLPSCSGCLSSWSSSPSCPRLCCGCHGSWAMRDRRRIHAEAHLRAERTKSESARDPRAASMERRR